MIIWRAPRHDPALLDKHRKTNTRDLHTATTAQWQGSRCGGQPRQKAELYDPAGPGRPPAVSWKAALARRTLLANGKVLVEVPDSVALGKCRTHDPATGSWTPTGSLTPNDGTGVFVARWQGARRWRRDTFTATAELYDSVSGTWTVTEA